MSITIITTMTTMTTTTRGTSTTITTMTMRTRSTSTIIMTTIMTSTGIITTTTITSATIRSAPATTITTTPTRSLPAGAREATHTFTEEDIRRALTALDTGDYGAILRAKGIVPTVDGRWLHFDYVPEEHEVRFGTADYTGRLCVIGSNLKEDGLKQLFGL